MKSFKSGNALSRELVGLIPSGGKASRVSPLPCSKELYPIGWQGDSHELSSRPKVVSHYLMEKMKRANVDKTFIILRKGKWDIPGYFGNGRLLDIHLAYLVMDLPFGVPYTVDQAFPFIQEATILFGFPDIIFKPDDAFERLLFRQTKSNADVVLGLFIAHDTQDTEMVDVAKNGTVRRVEIKPLKTKLRYTWIIAVWKPIFTQYIHDYVEKDKTRRLKYGSASNNHIELFLGNIIQAALRDNLNIHSVLFTQDSYLDIGTPKGLKKSRHIMKAEYGS